MAFKTILLSECKSEYLVRKKKRREDLDFINLEMIGWRKVCVFTGF